MAAKRPKKTVPKIKNPPEGPKAWAILPILPQGDAEAEPLYTAVGMALTQWEKLDNIQANLFGILVGSRLGAASKAFGTIVASSVRASFVITAAEVVLEDDPALLSETTKLLNDIGEFGARRNEIAHGAVNHYTSSARDVEGVVTTADHGHFLMPAIYAVKHRSRKEREFGSPATEGGRYAYTSEQVMYYTTQFAEHYQQLVALMWKVNAHCDLKWPPPVYRMPDEEP